MPTLFSWLRASTPEQALKDSHRRQIDGSRAWAKANDFEFGEVFLGSVSAFRGKQRALLQRFFDLAQEAKKVKPGDALFVENFDRLSRERVLDAIDLFRKIIDSGVTLVVRGQRYSHEIIEREGYRWHEIIGEMNRAHEESRRKSEMVSASYEERRRLAREQGKPISGKACRAWLTFESGGRNVSEGRYVINPGRLPTVVELFKLASSGWGLRDICKEFNGPGGKPPFGKRNKLGWQPGYVRKVLRDKAVLGIHTDPDGTEHKLFPQVIDEALFQRVQDALDGRRNTARGRNGSGYPNLVKGLCTCPVCGESVGMVTGRVTEKQTYKYLKCQSAGWGKCQHREMFPYWKLEPLLLSLYEIQEAVEGLLPRDNALVEEIAQTEASIRRKQATLEQQTPKLFEDRPAPVIEAISKYLDEIGAQLEQHKRDLVALRRRARLDEQAEERGFFERFYEAVSRMESPDPQVRDKARKHVAQELRRVIERVVLNSVNSITVQMKPRHGIQVEYELNQEKVVSVRRYKDGVKAGAVCWMTLPTGTVLPCLIKSDASGLLPAYEDG